MKGEELKKRAGVKKNQTESCLICGFTMSSIERYADMVTKSLSDYEFDNFVIGARIPTAMIEQEDKLRADLKLKGGETLKANFTRELNDEVSKQLDVEVTHRRPDITVIVNSLIDIVEVFSKSIFVYGRYMKKERGIPQKRRRCLECRGKGCPDCNLTGYSTTDSIEQRLTAPILSIFNAGRIKFTWIGSEDSNSLVQGEGRPFYAEILEPHIRKPKRIKSAIRKLRNGVFLKELKIIEKRPRSEQPFTINVQSTFTLNKRITKKKIQNLEEVFKEASVKMLPTNKNKCITKKIYNLTVESVKNLTLQVKMECDGGLSIRQFITGEGDKVEPNISSILKREVKMNHDMPFDILKVNLKV
jgi:tRNA pseudouridine synthase 10|tara:strand:- start:2424 stop:3500 length:1077 start_codon:yes stop_codon:yes gene_type:complete